MNTEQARFNMIEQQIRTWDVLDQDVLSLLTLVRREEFVPAAYRGMAFTDAEIPLPGGARMMTPKMEARIVQEVAPKKHESVLEIGAGSGYLAALLAHQARHVTTVEISPELKALAEKNLADHGIANVQVVQGNGAAGWPADGSETYDAIVVSGSLPVLPEGLLRQLKVGGRLFVIVGDAPVMTAQLVTRRSDTAFDTVKLFETVVEPLRDAPKPSRFTF
ncbi:MAG: protein-L-isoaspartate O-methyltransferase family protein [Burkholderiaceae bacterium]